MPTRVAIRDASTGKILEIEVEPGTTAEQLMESAVSYWGKRPAAYILCRNKKALPARGDAIGAGLKPNETLELMLDPQGG